MQILFMHALTFYLTYPFIYAIASLPFWALYRLSNFVSMVLRSVGYRKHVILNNLRNSFPEKAEAEIELLCSDYYRHLCDLMLETFKTLKMTKEETLERCVFHTQDWLTKLYEEHKSIIIVMGHHGNWEWAGPSFSLNTPYQLVVIYRPLSQPYFEKMMIGMRTRFGTRIVAAEKTLRDMVACRNEVTATAFIADQTATKKDAYWTTFLNQDTAVFTGPEKLARRFNYPVVYMHVQCVRRGYYEVTPELLFPEPDKTTENEISETFTNRLERDIILQPTFWLWSHKRWKHKREKNEFK